MGALGSAVVLWAAFELGSAIFIVVTLLGIITVITRLAGSMFISFYVTAMKNEPDILWIAVQN